MLYLDGIGIWLELELELELVWAIPDFDSAKCIIAGHTAPKFRGGL
jgi:hypothetical protein